MISPTKVGRAAVPVRRLIRRQLQGGSQHAAAHWTLPQLSRELHECNTEQTEFDAYAAYKVYTIIVGGWP